MEFFGSSNIEKMIREHDHAGLIQALEHRDPLIQLRAAQALAELSDGAGWRYLTEAVTRDDDASVQEAAAAILSELGVRSAGNAHRAVPSLGEALKNARGETADTIRDALLAIGGAEAEAALSEAGYTSSAEEPVEEVNDYDAHFIRPVMPDTATFEFLTAEQHLNNAVELREAELSERGLVECGLALWLKPDWAYAWYLRGVLFEDLERPYEAWLAYQRAVRLDPTQPDAREALQDLLEDNAFQSPEEEQLLVMLSSWEWKERRDAAAGLGELGEAHPENAEKYAAQLVELLGDNEREVRFAAVNALGILGSRSAVLPLSEIDESSWLLRFAIIEALSRLGSVDGLVRVLDREMEQQMNRNPSFSSIKDPLLGIEYERMVEIGVLALERTGDLESLLVIAEGNAWEEVDFIEELEETIENDEDAFLPEEDEFPAEEDLDSFVDEVGQMVAIALDRAARPRLSHLSDELLQRLAQAPDLTLIDLSVAENVEDEELEQLEDIEEEEPVVVYDLSALREAARSELARREGKPA